MRFSAVLALALAAATEATTEAEITAQFNKFIAKFEKEYTPAEYKTRRELFAKRLAEVEAHNAQGHSHTLAINHLSAHTEHELARLRGFDVSAHKAKLDKVPVELTERIETPDELDWRDEGKVTPVKNQGGCGSCWAFSGTGAIESALLMNNQTQTILSEQLYVDCAPNPDSCGGTGGCSGSIQPLLFEYAMSEGAVLEDDYAYTASTDTCKAALKTPVATIEGYEVLPENLSPEDMMQYLVTKGPLAVSVDASKWSFYSGGVFSYEQCGSDIDHAVMMVGYGTDPTYGDYWTIKNSWGSSWGEEGYIRISREDGNATDPTPQDGTGCADGPSEVTVRGTCGIYYANSYPYGAKLV